MKRIILILLLFATGCAHSNFWKNFSDAYNSSQRTSSGFEFRHVGAPAQFSAQTTDFVTTLEGCFIIAHDGQSLGIITRNELNPNSIMNELGKYGNELSSVSIFNQLGKYGNELSELSPFNEFTRTPPMIISPSGKFVAYLTKNEFMTPAIDPHILIGLLKSNQ